MNSKIIIVLLGLTFISFSLKSQVVSDAKSQATAFTLAEEAPLTGTYQIVLKTGTDKYELTNDELFQIEKKRDAEEITYIEVNANVKIKIYPITLIKSKDFVPFETYVYE